MDIAPFIVAELVRDDGDDREASLARSVAGALSSILTRDELLASADGSHALQLWEASDDTDYDASTARLNAATKPEAAGTRHLRSVE